MTRFRLLSLAQLIAYALLVAVGVLAVPVCLQNLADNGGISLQTFAVEASFAIGGLAIYELWRYLAKDRPVGGIIAACLMLVCGRLLAIVALVPLLFVTAVVVVGVFTGVDAPRVLFT